MIWMGPLWKKKWGQYLMHYVKSFFCVLFAAFSLEAKTVLVTGGSSGIGKACVDLFQAKGWDVIATYHTHPPQNENQSVQWVHLDLSNPVEIACVCDKLENIDVVLNNAGYALLGPDLFFTNEEVKQLFDVNFFGPVWLTKYLVPKLNDGGHLIYVSSTSGIRAVPGLGHYAATKFALEGFTESLAILLAPFGLHVSAVEPGSVKNEWVEKAVVSTDPLALRLKQKIQGLAKQGQSCEEIAEVLYAIANCDAPALRYQTSETVKASLSDKLKDLDGTLMREKMEAFFQKVLYP